MTENISKKKKKHNKSNKKFNSFNLLEEFSKKTWDERKSDNLNNIIEDEDKIDKNIINLPYSPNDGLTDRYLDIISISCYLKANILTDISKVIKKDIFPEDLLLLFGCSRLIVILIHELLGHLLKNKVSRISKNNLRNFTESNDKKNITKKKEECL